MLMNRETRGPEAAEVRMTDTQSPPVTAEGLLTDVKTFFDHGEFFRAYDLAA
ncbi:MAG: hypothetical protein QOG75_4516, partial [Mycobacterium sp.]|nr:hypothetical protein [Mycobacterium sp.]